LFLSFGLSFPPQKNCRSLSRFLFTFSFKKVLSAPLSFFPFSPLHSLCIYSQRERRPPCPVLSWCRAWWHAWGGYYTAATVFAGHGGVSEGSSRVVGFLILGEREDDKKLREKCFFFPYSLRVQEKKKAYDAIQNGIVFFF